MSTNGNMSPPDDASRGHAMTLRPGGPLEQQEAGWPVVEAGPPAPSLGLAGYLHSLRRHWVLAAGVGLLCAAVAAPAAWFGHGSKYEAKSHLRMSSQEHMLVFPTAATRETGMTSFDIYKETQRQLVTSRFVLIAALRKPEVARLPSIRREQDAVVWLAEQIRVQFPGDAEIMEVSLVGDDPQEAATLVNSVVEAYLTEVVNVERDQRRDRLSQLDTAYTEKETEVREKRNDLKQLAEQLGTSDKETLSLQQQLAIQQFAEFRSQRVRLQFDLRRAQGQLKAQEALLAAVDKTPISEYELDQAAWNDPIARQLAQELVWRILDQNYIEHYASPDGKSQHKARYQFDVQMVQAQYDQREQELREGIRGRKKLAIESEITQLQAQIGYLQEQLALVDQDVEQYRREAERIGSSSIDIEMMRREIDDLDRVLTGIADERERLRVELRNRPRVVRIQRAEVPELQVRKGVRWTLTVFALMAGLCVPMVGIAWWDSRAQRINTSADVSRGIGLPVMGSVPMIPARVIHQLGSPSRRNQLWRMRLTESADAIAARLLRKAEIEEAKVVLVTSASGAEGKTTLATQLTMSLARNGRSTVLVDFDLRRPSFHEVFGLSLRPGVCEVLRGEAELSDLVHPTESENLSVVTAGRWDRHALAALANAAAGAMFEKLRGQYDFVVVDASPVLPVADTRFLSQHVDTVILSVFRDVSEGPKVQAASEILEAFGVRSLEAVVTGPGESIEEKDLGYESNLPA